MTTVTLSVTTTSRPVLGNGGGGGGAIPPSNTVAPVLSGTPTVGQTLSCSTGTWLGTLPITYTYQWKRGVLNISGATSSTYTLVQADALQTITCEVTATNVAGSASATSNSIIAQDADAYAFLTAASITNTTQVDAINNLVINLKAASIWTKMKAIYPFVGGTATTHKFNLKNPADTNAAFRLVFSGGWTHSSTGATPNGVNAYADTFLVPNSVLLQNSTHISYYSRTNSNLTEIEIGASNGPNATDDKLVLEIRTSGVTYYNINSTTTYIQALDTDSRAFYIGNRTASNVVNGWRNNTKIVTGTTASTTPSTANVYLGAFNRTSSVALYSNKECAFASIGDGLTDTEALVFNQIVEGYQYELGRNVNPVNANYYNPAYNNETNAFLYASQITDNTQKSAVNTFVNNLKTAGVWTKMKAVYPLVGGTASTHKWNLVNPQDTDAAFRLVFSGGWTHSSTGALPNGTNAYADTFLNALTNMTIIDCSLGSYFAGTATANRTHIGYLGGTNQQFYLHNQSTSEKRGYTASSVSAGYYMSKSGLTSTTQRGFWAASNRSATDRAMICSDASFVYSTLSFSAAQLSFNLYIGARNNSGTAMSFDTMEHRLDFIGTALNDTELTNLRTIVTTFQTTLGRQV